MTWQDDGWRPPEEKEEMLVALRKEEHEEAHCAGNGLRKIQTKVVDLGNRNYVVIDAATMNRAAENARKMGEMILQMGAMMNTMQRRMDEMEANQRRVTMSHGEVKIIQGMIRTRAAEYCEKYQLSAAWCPRKIAAGIRKAILARYGVKDLHDVPAIARQAVEAQIGHWSDSRLMMACREKLAGGP